MNSRLQEFSLLALPKNSNIFHVNGQKLFNTGLNSANSYIFTLEWRKYFWVF